MVKECPKPHRAKGRLQPEIVERLQNVREALITVLPRVRCDPQHGGAPAGVSRDEWRTLPALFREHLCLFGKFKARRSEEHTSELQSLTNLVCRLLLEKKKKTQPTHD